LLLVAFVSRAAAPEEVLPFDDITAVAPLLKRGRLLYRSDHAPRSHPGVYWEIFVYRNGAEVVYPNNNLAGLQRVLALECPAFPGQKQMKQIVVPSLHTLYVGIAGSAVSEEFIERRFKRWPAAAKALGELRSQTAEEGVSIGGDHWACVYFVVDEVREGTYLYRYSFGGGVSPMSVSSFSATLLRVYPPDTFGEAEPR